MTFGEKLQALRSQAGMSQEALAENLEVSRQAVSKWERDEALPETEKVVRISRQFGVSTDYLLVEDAPEESRRGSRIRLRSLGTWLRDRGWLLGILLALWGGWQLLRLTAAWGNLSSVVSQGQMNPLQGVLWVLFVNRQKAAEAAGLLLAGLLWALVGCRRPLRWHHAGWLLVVWGGSYLLFQYAATALFGLMAASAFSSQDLAAQMERLWEGMGPQAVYGLGVALMGLLVALLGPRLEKRGEGQKPPRTAGP